MYVLKETNTRIYFKQQPITPVTGVRVDDNLIYVA